MKKVLAMVVVGMLIIAGVSCTSRGEEPAPSENYSTSDYLEDGLEEILEYQPDEILWRPGSWYAKVRGEYYVFETEDWEVAPVRELPRKEAFTFCEDGVVSAWSLLEESQENFIARMFPGSRMISAQIILWRNSVITFEISRRYGGRLRIDIEGTANQRKIFQHGWHYLSFSTEFHNKVWYEFYNGGIFYDSRVRHDLWDSEKALKKAKALRSDGKPTRLRFSALSQWVQFSDDDRWYQLDGDLSVPENFFEYDPIWYPKGDDFAYVFKGTLESGLNDIFYYTWDIVEWDYHSADLECCGQNFHIRWDTVGSDGYKVWLDKRDFCRLIEVEEDAVEVYVDISVSPGDSEYYCDYREVKIVRIEGDYAVCESKDGIADVLLVALPDAKEGQHRVLFDFDVDYCPRRPDLSDEPDPRERWDSGKVENKIKRAHIIPVEIAYFPRRAGEQEPVERIYATPTSLPGCYCYNVQTRKLELADISIEKILHWNGENLIISGESKKAILDAYFPGYTEAEPDTILWRYPHWGVFGKDEYRSVSFHIREDAGGISILDGFSEILDSWQFLIGWRVSQDVAFDIREQVVRCDRDDPDDDEAPMCTYRTVFVPRRGQ